METFNKGIIAAFAGEQDVFVKHADVCHELRIETKFGSFELLYAASSSDARTVGALAFAGGAKRYWVDGKLEGGPIEELIHGEG